MNLLVDLIDLPLDIYNKHLETIGGVRFTPREVDVVACILNGRSAKTIPSLLSISPKTVSAHMTNIRMKTSCSTRESIIDFMEKSDKLAVLKNQYYFSLLTHSFFEKQLEKISQGLPAEKLGCHITCQQEREGNAAFLSSLEQHLRLLGFDVKVNGKAESLTQANFHIKILSEYQQTRESDDPDDHILLFRNNANLASAKGIDFSDNRKYYDSFYTLLEILLPQVDVNVCRQAFQDYTQGLVASQTSNIPLSTDSALENERGVKNVKLLSSFTKRKKQMLLAGLLVIFCSIISIPFLTSPNRSLQSSEAPIVRSDLILPSEITLVDRSQLFSQMDKEFEQQAGLKSLGIVGIGGAGKTTLARTYAKYTQNKIIWELNGETPESLMRSFEGLAQALATDEKDQKKLRSIIEISDSASRQEKIVPFVRERLRRYPGWLIIFDNVENYKDIEKYYPHDEALWGSGTIIITSRNSALQNNNPINSVVQIGELDAKQKLTLFKQLFQKNHDSAHTRFNEEQAEAFLKEIPPFPLDVCMAACYIKCTGVSYKDYLLSLNDNEEAFSGLQESVLYESGSHNKTRYKIIALSTRKLLKSDQDFEGLLLLISLLGSENIPKDLLYAYKNNLVVDKFVYGLKKYSLVTEGTLFNSTLSTLSCHRSTQKIVLDYLKRSLKPESQKNILLKITKALDQYLSQVVYVKEELPVLRCLTEHFDKLLKADNPLPSDIRIFLEAERGHIHFLAGNHKIATEILEKNLESVAKHNCFNSRGEALTLSYLAEMYKEYRQADKAIPLLEKSLQIYLERFPNDHYTIADALSTYGNCYRMRDDHKNAILYFEKAESVFKSNIPSSDARYAKFLGLQAYAYVLVGNYSKAEKLLTESLRIYTQDLTPNFYNLGRTYAFLGEANLGMGNLEQAQANFERAITLFNDNLEESQARRANALSVWGIGMIAHKSGDTKKAKTILNEVYETRGIYYGYDNNYTAHILIDLADIELHEDDLQAAEENLTKSMQIFKDNNCTNIYRCLESFALLHMKKALIAQKSGDKVTYQTHLDHSKSYLLKAIDVAHKHLPGDSPHLERLQTKLKAVL